VTVASHEPAAPAARRRRSAILAAAVSASAALIAFVASHLAGPWLARGEAVGAIGRGLTVFDNDRPAVANLDPDLLRALRRAARDAARDGVTIYINSGWRSPEYQERLHLQAVWKYRSPEKAARWVATADTSSHVSGDAVDIGPSRATGWLSRHGARYRLCQIYRNEPWHYELRPNALDRGCPPMYADPGHDPRMQQ
jgi:D-alanyl-D-alanine carboxypeptidase